MGKVFDIALCALVAILLLMLALAWHSRPRRMTIRDLLTEQDAERASGLLDGEVVTIPADAKR